MRNKCQVLSKCLKASVQQPHVPPALSTVYSRHVVTFTITVKVVFQVMNSSHKFMSAVHSRLQNCHSIRIPCRGAGRNTPFSIFIKGNKIQEIILFSLLPPNPNIYIILMEQCISDLF